MDSNSVTLFGVFGLGVVLTLLVGFVGLLTTRNLIRALINLEVLTKAVTLLIIVSGYVAKQIALAQSLAITLILIEVAVIVVAVSIVLSVHRKTDSIDTASLRNIKG
jgi:NADH-quinone oxidoreductase subunit K